MPWSNQGGGSGGGGRKGGGNGGGPWGQGGGSGGGQPPDLDEILRRGQDKVKQVMRGGGGGGGPGGGGGLSGLPMFMLGLLGLLAVLYYGFFFTVNPDQLGIVLRLGKFDRQEPPGFHFRWPYPIEEVRKPEVTKQRTIEVPSSARGSRPSGGPDSGLMLTGDGSVVDVRFVVFWRLKTERDEKTGQSGVEQYLFNIAKPETTVQEVAESAMREIVGKSALQPLLTSGRQKAQDDVQKLMQSILDFYRSGIKIDQVQLKEVDPPQQVIAAFRDVAAAGQDKERFIKEAQTYADQIVPRAKGDADRILAGAEGFRDQQIAEATGQAARFLKVYEEYKKAPDVTRQRLFLEMQEKVLSGADKIILDSKGGNAVVPYLPLDQLQKKKPDGGQP